MSEQSVSPVEDEVEQSQEELQTIVDAPDDDEVQDSGSSTSSSSTPRKSGFSKIRMPTVIPFRSLAPTQSVSQERLCVEESIESASDDEHLEKQICENEAEFFKQKEELLREKSDVIMQRLRKALPEFTPIQKSNRAIPIPSASKMKLATIDADDGDCRDEDSQDSDFTPLFQTDVPEETMEKARQMNAHRQSSLDKSEKSSVQKIINAKVVEHYQRGIELADGGRYEAAIISFTRALNLRPTEVQCYVERAEAYLQLCDLHSAYLNYKKAHSLEPEDSLLFDKVAFVSYLEGQCLFDQRLFSDALKKFATSASMKPDNTSYHMRAIACLAALDKSKDCLALVSRLISNKGDVCDNPELFVLRARLHLKFNNASLAYYDVQEALRQDEQLPQALALIEEMKKKAEDYRNHAVTLALELRFGEAISKISLAVDTNPMEASHHVYRGSLHRRVNNFNEAIDDFLLAIDKCKHDETNPTYIDAQRQLLITYNDFAVYCYKREFYDEAVTLLNKAIKGEKNEVGLYLNRGDCFFKLNSLEFALADYEQALEMNSELWSCKCRIAIVYNELGIIAYHDRQYENAVMKFNEAIYHNGKVAQLYIHRARCFYILQTFHQSRDDLLMAMMLDPNNKEIVPFLSRLFPGRSVNEILESSLMHQARQRLSTVLETATDPKTKECASTVNRTETDTIESISSSLESLNKLNSQMNLVMEKKKVRNDLNKMLSQRTVIKSTGPHVQTKLTVGCNDKKEIVDPLHKPVYKWKQFN